MVEWRRRWPQPRSKGHNSEEEVEEAATSKCLTQRVLNVCTCCKRSVERWPGYVSVGSKPGLKGSLQKKTITQSPTWLFCGYKVKKISKRWNYFDLNSREDYFRCNRSRCPYPTSDSVNAPKVWALINSWSLLRADNWRPIIPVMECRHIQAVSLQFTQRMLG